MSIIGINILNKLTSSFNIKICVCLKYIPVNDKIKFLNPITSDKIKYILPKLKSIYYLNIKQILHMFIQ